MNYFPSLGMKVWKYRWGRGGPWVLAAAASGNTAAEPGCREAFRWTHGVSISPRLCQDAWGRGTAAGLPPVLQGPGWEARLEINCLLLGLVARIWVLWAPEADPAEKLWSWETQKNPVDLWDPGKESPEELNYSQEWIPPAWDGILTQSSFFLPLLVVQSLSCVQFCDPHGLQHTRLLCPSLSSRVCSSSCPLSRWCYPTISSLVAPFSFCLPPAAQPSGHRVLGHLSPKIISPLLRALKTNKQNIQQWASKEKYSHTKGLRNWRWNLKSKMSMYRNFPIW